MRESLWRFFVREWLLVGALSGLVLTSLYLGRLPRYDWPHLRPVFLLWILFVVIKGLENSRLLCRVARKMERGRRLGPKMVMLSFFLSMFLTIDVSLVTLLPILMGMRIRHKVPLTVLVALTAHAGAALTPFGTPQNLFIFSYYHVHVAEFLRVMAPFAGGLVLAYLVTAFFLGETEAPEAPRAPAKPLARTMAGWYLLFFLLAVGAVLGVVPLVVASLVLFFAFAFDELSLKVDYALLATFVVFVGLTGNIRALIDGSIAQISHTYYLAAGLSQFISNVPATLILERFTDHWRSLLWGVNAGGYGTLVAALANLIAYRLAAAGLSQAALKRFTTLFLAGGFLSLLLATGLHYLFFDYIHFYVE
ncbi:SLC13 family permease [Hydrogenimonas sp.]